MQLYLIRHAQSENNALWARTQSENGRSPDPLLTEVGQKQAKAVAHFLARSDANAPTDKFDIYNRKGFPFTHLYCSLMQRAIQTATAIAQAKGMSLTAWEMIHEWGGIYEHDLNGGQHRGLEGPNRAFFAEHYPHLSLPSNLNGSGWWNRPFETREECYQRAQRFVQALEERHGDTDDKVAIVTHGGFFYSFMSALLGSWGATIDFQGDKRIWMAVNNASITRVDFNDTHIRVAYMNRIDFLSPDLIT